LLFIHAYFFCKGKYLLKHKLNAITTDFQLITFQTNPNHGIQIKMQKNTDELFVLLDKVLFLSIHLKP